MALVPDNSGIAASVSQALNRASRFVGGLFQGFSPEQAMHTGPILDARLAPRVPMSNENIDISTLAQLGDMGMKRGKLITAESHPELVARWEAMAVRAGVQLTPQLILTESDALNAVTLTKEEAAITTGLMKILTLDEACAVLGHELGHAQSDHALPRILAGGVLGGLGLLAGNAAGRHLDIGRHASNLVSKWEPMNRVLNFVYGEDRAARTRPASLIGYAVYMAIGALIGGVAAMQLSVRPTELDADAKGAAISGDPLALASALTKLEAHYPQQGIIPFVKRFMSGYPTTQERVEHLQRLAQTPAPQHVAPVTPEPTRSGPGTKLHEAMAEDRVNAPTSSLQIA